TSLVETFRLYADPNYQAKTEHITQGNSRFADEKVKITAFLADLHTVQIRKLKANAGGYDVIDLEEEAKRLSEVDFEQLLYLGAKGAETVIIASDKAKKYRFNIYEGPGLSANAENLEKNILSINKTLVGSEQKFHQVLFTLAPGPITSATRTTIQICSDVFSNFVPFFSFVHTKIDYPKLLFGNKQFQDSMKERHELLRRHIHSSAASYMIDCNLQSNWPVQRANTHNIVRDILAAATVQTPVILVSSGQKIVDTTAISILVLGGQRSGKSSFVEHAKTLAETIDRAIVEILPSAEHVSKISRTVFDSSAPEYEVVRLRNMTQFNVMHMDEIFGEDTTGSMEQHEMLRSSEDNFFTDVNFRGDFDPPPTLTKYAILDTPSINNSAEDDESIISALASTRSFNLILIAVSYLHPLTIELQQALEYYSNVLRGLHCNIAFLHTHIDYADHHPHNEDFYQNLKLRNLLLGRIFQTQGLSPEEGDSRSHMEPQDDEMEQHPSFIIDLGPDEGPIVQGLNRNTIREILLLAASNSPLEIDTSEKNLSRILSIPHPRNLTDEAHKAVKMAILEEDERQKGVFITDDRLGRRYKARDSLFHHTRVIYSKLVDVPEKTKYSVLVLGRTQAGKSTLIEHIKSYVDPNYSIDWSLIGNDIVSKTETTLPFVVESDLPTYEVCYKDSGDIMDLNDITTRYKDEEDYRDTLDLRKGLIIRKKPGDMNMSPALFEFRFLDTPGFNDTKDQDFNHATKILDEMISSQHFNLILILVPNATALTQEYQVALEYYSDVLRGLHSRIILLHTKVEYALLHHSNANFHRKLEEKNASVFDILQRPFFKPCPIAMEEGDLRLHHYSSLTIDLVSNKRPVIQCLIRKTIREILKEAMAPPVVLDTSAENIKRMRKVILPYKASKELREKAKLLRILDDPHWRDSPPVQTSEPLDSRQKVSVLLLGRTAAGMSTFIEFFKQYVDQEYSIDRNLVGNGYISTTPHPIRHVVRSFLPSYEILDINGTRIEIDNLAAEHEDIYDYMDALKNRKVTMQSVSPDPGTPPPQDVEITFLDTPGIENTEGKDFEQAPRIMEEIIKMQSLNLIIIVVNSLDHPSTTQQLAFDYYSKIIQTLQGHQSNVVFLYTNAKYEENHPSKVKYLANMDLRHKAFSQLFRGGLRNGAKMRSIYEYNDSVELYPCYTVDLSIYHRPIPRCLMLNSLRDILQLAATNTPAVFDTSRENLDRVWNIPYPEGLNKGQRNKILGLVKAVLDNNPSDGDGVSVVGSDDKAGGYGVEAGGQLIDPEEDDYLEYFGGTLEEYPESDCD
ncbi:hypothetical protein BG000_000552, partial [Podila horticola]